MIKRILNFMWMIVVIISIVCCLSSCCCPLIAPSIIGEIESNSAAYKWYNADGSLLYETVGDPTYTNNVLLPQDNEKWDYIEWRVGNNDHEFVAYRVPQNSYFIGNVFQIVTKDLANCPVSTGSAFVFTRDGWFITNAHVMDQAHSAQAIFNIPNQATGESFTYLDINQGSYCHIDKDIYIGKIDNYSSIQSYYQDIPVNVNYEIGQPTYSVGYPNSSTELIIKQGEVTESRTDLYDKLYSGNTYICSSSEIYPGSSGGILVNDDLEVIGITTLGWFDSDMSFISGAAISAFNFVNLFQDISENDLISVQERFHKDEKVFINYFNAAMTAYDKGETTVFQFDDGTLAYIYEWEKEDVNDEGYAFTSYERIVIGADSWISYTTEYYWDTGVKRTTKLYGYYDPYVGLENFAFEFLYEWNDGSYFALESVDVNYSTNLSLTLKNYTTDNKWHSVDKEEIEYAKEQFNACYETLVENIEKYQ